MAVPNRRTSRASDWRSPPVRRAFSPIFAFCVTVATSIWPAAPARAADPPAAARQEWSIRSVANNLFVTAEISKVGADNGMLRARNTSAGAWERFTLHNANDSDGSTFSIKSLANGKFVSAEVSTTGTYHALLRARSDTVGAWETFTLTDGGDSDPNTVAIWSVGANAYVSAELNATGEDTGMLRARSSSVGSWERFVLTSLTEPPPPAPTSGSPTAGATTVSVMSWNVCAANNSNCPFYHTTAQPLADAIAEQATAAGFNANAILLQEICETHAKPVELELEARTGRGWDVRFAPSYERLPGITPAIMVQKSCSRDVNGVPRGSYGIALALPDENTWYHWYPLPSPPPTVSSPPEQRVALCGTVGSTQLHICATHFSPGSPTLPPASDFRPEQAQALLTRVEKSGYRTIFGGDLNLSPPDDPDGDAPLDALVPVYSAYEECNQSAYGGLRDGAPTYGTKKIDYIFGPTNATYSCRVGTTTLSDHKPLFVKISLP